MTTLTLGKHAQGVPMTPEIVHNMPEAEYFAKKYASKSTICKLLKSPLALRRSLDGLTDKKTDALCFGTAVDAYIFAPSEFDARVAVMPDCNRATKEGKAIFEKWADGKEVEWVKKGNGQVPIRVGTRVIIDEEQFASLPHIKAALKAHPLAGRLLAGLASSQESVFWDDHGMRCRARLDGRSVLDGESVIWDLKTCANIENISLDALKFGYPIQAAMYQRGLLAVDGMEPNKRRFIFIFVQSTPDEDTGLHPVAKIEYGQYNLEVIHPIVDGALKLWKQCEETNSWPGPSYEPRSEEVPEWWISKMLGRVTPKQEEEEI